LLKIEWGRGKAQTSTQLEVGKKGSPPSSILMLIFDLRRRSRRVNQGSWELAGKGNSSGGRVAKGRGKDSLPKTKRARLEGIATGAGRKEKYRGGRKELKERKGDGLKEGLGGDGLRAASGNPMD